MNILFWIKSAEIKEKEAKQQKHKHLKNEARQKKLIALVINKHTIKVNKMITKNCPINNMNLCTIKCVHFNNATPNAWYSKFRDKAYAYASTPGCKLWSC